MYKICFRQSSKKEDCHGGPVVKNPPANAGDTGSISGLRRIYVSPGNRVQAPQLLSLCSGACESQACSSQNLCSTTGEATRMESLHPATREYPLLAATREIPRTQKPYRHIHISYLRLTNKVSQNQDGPYNNMKILINKILI